MAEAPIRAVTLLALASALLAAAGCTRIGAAHGSFGRPPCTGSAAVQPPGAPYCYLRPSTMRRGTKPRLGTRTEVSAVGVDTNDLVVVGDAGPGQEYAGLSDAQLLRELAKEITSAGASQVSISLSSGRVQKVPGGRMVGYDAVGTTGRKPHIRLHLVFSPQDVVQVNCQWVDPDQQDAVLAGCRSVLTTLRFTGG